MEVWHATERREESKQTRGSSVKWDIEVDGNWGRELTEKFNYSHIHGVHLFILFFFVVVPILFVIYLFNSVLTSQEKL